MAGDHGQFPQGDGEALDRVQWKPFASEFRRQVEGLLTPQQVTALNDIRLHDKLRGLSQDRELVKKLGITEEQKVRLRRIAGEYGRIALATSREAKEKSLAVPTAAQRQKLRDELDRRGAW